MKLIQFIDKQDQSQKLRLGALIDSIPNILKFKKKERCAI